MTIPRLITWARYCDCYISPLLLFAPVSPNKIKYSTCIQHMLTEITRSFSVIIILIVSVSFQTVSLLQSIKVHHEIEFACLKRQHPTLFYGIRLVWGWDWLYSNLIGRKPVFVWICWSLYIPIRRPAIKFKQFN